MTPLERRSHRVQALQLAADTLRGCEHATCDRLKRELFVLADLIEEDLKRVCEPYLLAAIDDLEAKV